MSYLVVGGASGIGRSTAEHLHSDGEKVIIADIVEPEVWLGSYLECDVTEESDVDTMMRFAFDVEPPTSLIYSAGGQIARPFWDLTPENHEQMWRVNYLGAAMCARYWLRYCEQGSITFVSSIAGMTSGGPGLTAYGASKAAVISLTKTLAIEMAPAVRVNCVCPGWTDTPFNNPVIEEMGGRLKWEQQVLADVPKGYAAAPWEIAEAIVFLSSHRASYITGAVLVVDGGMSV